MDAELRQAVAGMETPADVRRELLALRQKMSVEFTDYVREIYPLQRRSEALECATRSMYFESTMPLIGVVDFFVARDGGPEMTPRGLAAESGQWRGIEIACSQEQAAAILAVLPLHMEWQEWQTGSGWYMPADAPAGAYCAARAAITAAWAAILGVCPAALISIRATGWVGSESFLSETFGEGFSPNWTADSELAAIFFATRRRRELSAQLSAEHGAWLRESYVRRQNPLPGMRRRVGGTWEFARPGVRFPEAESPCGEIEIPGVGRVRWTPAE